MQARVTRRRIAPATLEEAIRIPVWASAEEMRAGETSSYYRDQIDKVRALLAGEPDVHGDEVVLHDVRTG